MEFPATDQLNRYLAMGIFAFYIVGVSLWRIMAEQEFFLLTAMKKIWGRRRGLSFHFLSNVALPLVVGIVFFSQGVVHDEVAESRKDRLQPPWFAQSAHLLLADADLSFAEFTLPGELVYDLGGLGLEGPLSP
jgi:hypothetical protein